MLLGGVLSGRRSTYQMEEEFRDDTHLTSFRQEAEGQEGKTTMYRVKEVGPGRVDFMLCRCVAVLQAYQTWLRNAYRNMN